MGTTAEFLKLRSNGTPQLGEWNINYNEALALAKQNYKFIITCWSNGDMCGYCIDTEKCMMEPVFIDWMKTSDAYFVFQYSGDPDKGKTVHDWIYVGTPISFYPGFRITLYDANGKILVDQAVEGNTLRAKMINTYGANEMIKNLSAILAKKPPLTKQTIPAASTDYKIRLNEERTVAQINRVLDAIDANDGYCPCQVQTPDTKCHCKDFIENKEIGEPCICGIYVKQKKG